MEPTITWLTAATALDALDHALIELHAAIALVVAGVAVRITLSFFDGAEGAAFSGVAWAQAAGVAFRVRHDPSGSISLVIGPRLTPTVPAIANESGS